MKTDYRATGGRCIGERTAQAHGRAAGARKTGKQTSELAEGRPDGRADGQAACRAEDRRVRRTRSRITSAYLELRRGGGRITVTELARRADINKTTFYQHYRDIADLERQVEKDLVESFLDDVERPEYFISGSQRGIFEISRAFARHSREVFALYTPEQLPAIADRVEKAFEERVLARRPDLRDDREGRLMLTFLIHGSFDTFFEHIRDDDIDWVVAVINNLRECLVRGYAPLDAGER